jgi:DNA invertase Pin-like site-specific DNA recombinase
MDSNRSQGLGRRVRWQAAAIAVVVAADGLVAYAFGGPAWLAVLYVLLAAAVAGGRLWLARRGPIRAPTPAPEAPLAPQPPKAPRRAIAYALTDAPGNGQPGAHVEAIEACCDERGLTLVALVHDVERDNGANARPSLAWALEQLAEGKADALVVPRLRDLARNVANLPPLLSWFDQHERRLIAIDLGVDTATEAGRLAASAVAGVGGWEHEHISQRTRRGLEAARSRGAGNGRAAVADVPELADRIQAMREQGMTLQAIADRLNAEGVPTLRGGAMWRPSSVQRATGYRRPSASSRGIVLPKSRP